MLLGRAIDLFPEPSPLRRMWLFGLKKLLGICLRLGWVPQKDRSLIGTVHSQIASVLSGGGGCDCSGEMVMEVSSICNAKCSFCPYPTLEFAKKVMTDEMFSRSMEFAAGLAIHEFDLTPHLGEAFVDPDFLKRIHYLHGRFPHAGIRFTTNGTFLLRTNCEELLMSGIRQINVSFGAWGRDDYIKLYNIDAWETVFSGVRKLLDTKKRLKAGVKIVLWYKTLNAEKVQANPENKQFLEFYRDYIDEIDYTDIFHDIPSISGKQPKHICLARRIDASSLKQIPCAYLSKLAVSSTGNILMCYCAATDSYKQSDSWFYLGSLHQTPFDINKSLQAKIEAWEQGEMPECCKTCPVYVPAKRTGMHPLRGHKINKSVNGV